jgi:HSP20 family molecular chaperone IbpA
VANGVLHIRALGEDKAGKDKDVCRSEFRYRSFVRNVPARGVKEGDVMAGYKDGILEVSALNPADEEQTGTP